MARKKKTVTIKKGGVGDTVEKVLKKTGVKKVVEYFTDGKDCGCNKRKQVLNELLPYRYKARCFTEIEYNKWKEFKEVRTVRLQDEHIKYVCEFFASVFNRQVWYPCRNCSPKPIIDMIEKLDLVYDTYNINS
jgi:hypothetical protein